LKYVSTSAVQVPHTEQESTAEQV
jgi:hypothetical protein